MIMLNILISYSWMKKNLFRHYLKQPRKISYNKIKINDALALK